MRSGGWFQWEGFPASKVAVVACRGLYEVVCGEHVMVRGKVLGIANSCRLEDSAVCPKDVVASRSDGDAVPLLVPCFQCNATQ